jgi:carbon monoxide dehydrogenase subunit G
MEFDNAFEVPLPPAQAWPLLLDIRRIAPCMPGAELTEVVDDKTYKGRIAVRLGPVALSFSGTVTFDEIDAAHHRARVSAQGSDTKGRGAANAVAGFRIEPAEAGSKVLVHTNLTLSGAVAQYGRGVGIIQVTAAQIVGQFAAALKAQLERAPGPGPGADTAAAAPPAGAPMPPAARPISGFRLMLKVLWDYIRRAFGRS